MLPSLTDIDECDTGMNDCDVNASCTNTIGSFDCMCNIGYSGDGFNCTGLLQHDIGHALS